MHVGIQQTMQYSNEFYAQNTVQVMMSSYQAR